MYVDTWSMIPIARGPWHRAWAPSNYMGRCVFGSTTRRFDLCALHLDASPPLLAQAQAQTKTAHSSVSGSPDLNQTEENSINTDTIVSQHTVNQLATKCPSPPHPPRSVQPAGSSDQLYCPFASNQVPCICPWAQSCKRRVYSFYVSIHPSIHPSIHLSIRI